MSSLEKLSQPDSAALRLPAKGGSLWHGGNNTRYHDYCQEAHLDRRHLGIRHATCPFIFNHLMLLTVRAAHFRQALFGCKVIVLIFAPAF